MNKNGKINLNLIIIILVVLDVLVFFFLYKDNILNLFNKKPCEISLLTTELTNDKVLIKIDSLNQKNITKDGIDTEKISLEDSILENGEYFYSTVDSPKTCSIKINNIDKVLPNINITSSTNEKVESLYLTLSGSDDQALDDKPYSWDKINWTSEPKKEINLNGNYTGYIKDKAGNINSTSYSVTNIEKYTDEEELSININEKKQIKVNDGVIKCLSSDTNIVIIDDKGNIQGINEGNARVSIWTTKGTVYVYNVKVLYIRVSEITLNMQELFLTEGEAGKLEISSQKPQNSVCKKTTWNAENEAIVSVKDGLVSAKKSGNTNIIFTCDDVTVKTKVTVIPKVSNFSLTNPAISLKPKEKETISITNIVPSNAVCKNVTWTSSDSKIATVNNGVVTAVKDGTVTITASCNGINKKAIVIVKSISNPLIPTENIKVQYDSSSLKYYITKKTDYYLTYIWMSDPYNQVKKLDATTAVYNKTYTDIELKTNNLKTTWKTVPEMIDLYIKNNRISTSKGLVAFNASGFSHLPYFGSNKDTDGYASGWVNITDGIYKRNNTSSTDTKSFLGITKYGNIKVYSSTKTSEDKNRMVNELKNDGVNNTYCFGSAILKDGIVSTTKTDINKRSGVCQVDGNNFIVLSGTTRKGYSYKDVAEIFQKLGCKTAYSLDGGDSVSIAYKKNNASKATVQYCNDTYGESRASSKTKCRYIVEGIYFVEK